MQKNSLRITYSFAGIIIISLLIALTATHFFLLNINSDFLYGYELVADVLRNHSFEGQDFPIAPYFFPDLALTFLLRVTSSNITVLQFEYTLIFLLVFSYLLYRLIRQTNIPVSFAMLGTIISLFLTFLILPPEMPLIRVFAYSHLSIVLFSFYLVGSYLILRHREISTLQLLGLGLLTYLMLVSDSLVFIQLLVPFSILLIVDLLRGKTNKKFAGALLCLVLLATLLSVKTPEFLARFFNISYSYNVSLFRIKNLDHLDGIFFHALQVFMDSMHAAKLFYGMALFYNLATGLTLFILYHKSQKRESLNNLLWIISFLYLAQFTTLIIVTITGKLLDTTHLRYLHIIFIYPAVALALCIVQLLQNKIYTQAVSYFSGSVLACCLAIFMMYNLNYLTSIPFGAPTTSTVQCLDALQKRYALQNGLAEYWNARSTRLLSQSHLHIAQINHNLRLTKMIDNLSHFYADIDDKIPLNYQFIITSHLPTERLLNEIGKPDTIAYCPNTEVWLYLKRNSAKKLNHYFLPQLDRLTGTYES